MDASGHGPGGGSFGITVEELRNLMEHRAQEGLDLVNNKFGGVHEMCKLLKTSATNGMFMLGVSLVVLFCFSCSVCLVLFVLFCVSYSVCLVSVVVSCLCVLFVSPCQCLIITIYVVAVSLEENRGLGTQML